MRTASATILLCVLSAAPARAAEVVVLEPVVPADFAERLRNRLSEEGAARLAAAGLTVRQGADIEVAARAARECEDARCLRERLGATGARLAARIRITATPAGLTAKLEVTSLRAGVVLATEEANCAGCTAQAATEVALSLIDGLEIPERDPASPPDTSAPRAVDTTVPAPRPSEPDVDLGPTPAPRRRISGWVWISGATGLALIAGGIPLLVIDGEPTCDGPSRSCPEVYDTGSGGWSLVAIGVAGLAAAVVMAIVGAPGETSFETDAAVAGTHP